MNLQNFNVMLINELSKRSGVTVHTLRYYENIGLIQGKVNEAVKSNNYKDYDEQLLDRIEMIKEAKEAGFTLAEIKYLLDRLYSGHFPVNEQLQIVDAKIREIEAKIIQLKQVKKLLEQVKKDVRNGGCV
jgi:MerR family copper efflux transcriptional regulator